MYQIKLTGTKFDIFNISVNVAYQIELTGTKFNIFNISNFMKINEKRKTPMKGTTMKATKL